MTTKEDLITQHIREYESRLKHIDELYAKADKVTAHLDADHTARAELQDLASKRDELQEKTEALQTMSLKNWEKDTIQRAGPMGIWDIVAQRLEHLIERHK